MMAPMERGSAKMERGDREGRQGRDEMVLYLKALSPVLSRPRLRGDKKETGDRDRERVYGVGWIGQN